MKLSSIRNTIDTIYSLPFYQRQIFPRIICKFLLYSDLNNNKIRIAKEINSYDSFKIDNLEISKDSIELRIVFKYKENGNYILKNTRNNSTIHLHVDNFPTTITDLVLLNILLDEEHIEYLYI